METETQALPRYVRALRTPRAVALAGVFFALSYGAAVVLVRLAFPGNITLHGGWAATSPSMASLAIQLVVYAGIAFLWFMGVVRTRIGVREDRFLSTVFMGSGLLFLAMTYCAAALSSALLHVTAPPAAAAADSASLALAARVAYELTNHYAVRMAAVFMISLGTLCLRTGAMPRGFVWLSYALAAALLMATSTTLWVTLAFPAWVLGFSLYLLWHGFGSENQASA